MSTAATTKTKKSPKTPKKAAKTTSEDQPVSAGPDAAAPEQAPEPAVPEGPVDQELANRFLDFCDYHTARLLQIENAAELEKQENSELLNFTCEAKNTLHLMETLMRSPKQVDMVDLDKTIAQVKKSMSVIYTDAKKVLGTDHAAFFEPEGTVVPDL